jgi:tetratricopeptide (TPR) repeat protein
LPLPAANLSEESPRQPREGLYLAALLLLTALSYGATLGFDFVSDDHLAIERNVNVSSWGHLPSHFTAHLWSHVPSYSPRYYRPFLLTWFLANRSLFGLHPGLFHATSVLVHLLAVWLVYALAARLLSDRRSALVAALVFALHPIHVESVAWISGACDLLVTVFFLGACLSYLRAAEAPSRRGRWMFLALLLFAGALLSKEIAVGLPALVFLYACFTAGSVGWPQRCARALGAAFPFLTLAVLFLVLRARALGSAVGEQTPVAFPTVLYTAPGLLVFYLRLLFFPLNLSPHYEFPYVTAPTALGFLLPVGLLLLTVAAAWRWSARARDWRFACAALALLVPLLPALNSRWLIEDDLVHDRYLYLGSVGFALLVALAFQALPDRFLPRGRNLAPALLGVAALALAFATMQQSFYWKNDITLYSRAVQVAPHNFKARISLAAAYQVRGRLPEAIAQYQQAVALQPSFVSTFSLAVAYFQAGDLTQAERYFRWTITLAPRISETYVRLGMIRIARNDAPQAEQLFRTALAISPAAPGYHFALGMALAEQGKGDAAMAAFQEELRLYPDQPIVRETMRKLQSTLHSGAR